MFVKAHCLGILFVDGHFPDALLPDAVFQQLPAKPFPPFIRGEEQHFQAAIFGSHEGHRHAGLAFCHKRPCLTDLNNAINYNEIYEQLMQLSLCVYAPSNYIFPS